MSNPNARPLAVPKSRIPSKQTGREGHARASVSDLDEEEDISYEEREARDQAARVLANDEMLLLLSRQRNESVLQTRLYCQARAAGLDDERLKFDYTMDLSEESKPNVKTSAAKGTARVVSGSSKNSRAASKQQGR